LQAALVYNERALRNLWAFALLLAAVAAAQQTPTPQVRVNVLNVCTPGTAEQQEIAAALARIPQQPSFTPDFEVARGRSTAPDAPSSRWVRMRHEFPETSPFATVQYSFSVDERNNVLETLVWRLRQDKDLMQMSLERSAEGVTPGEALGAAPVVTRIRLEHFGKASVALARCRGADQSAYEALFRAAANLLGRYRTALNVRRTVMADLARIGAASPTSKK